MANQEALYNVRDRVATITLNRPDKLNAWTATMEQEVRAAMHQAEHDQDVRVIVLTGAGRGFCAGADMSLLGTIAQQGLGDRGQENFLRNTSNGGRQNVRADFQKKYSYFPSIEKPVIAAVNGPAVGLGFIISLYCDLRFASDYARFGTAFAKRGLRQRRPAHGTGESGFSAGHVHGSRLCLRQGSGPQREPAVDARY
jgi:enoyl-CoA hydratase/carnithine racemase